MLYLVIAVLAVVAVCVALPMLRRSTRRDEVDRFHIARALTTTWASQPDVPAAKVPAQGERQE